MKSTKLEADAADVDSTYNPVDVSDWSRDELAVNFGFAAGGGGIVIGYQDNTTVNESTPTEGDIELASSGLTFAYGLVGMFGESDFGYSATLGFGFMEGNYSDDLGTDVDADYTLGYSLGAGLSWAPLEGLTLGADYKWQSYEFDFTGTSDVTIEEVISRLVLSAAYTF